MRRAIDYVGNAQVYERHRQECEQLAAEAIAAGDEQKAATFRQYAEQWRRNRDEEVERQLRARLSRGLHRLRSPRGRA